MPTPRPRTPLELLNALTGSTPQDSERHLQRLYQDLASHNDPMLREIGTQLRDGVMKPRQLFSTPGYDEVAENGLAFLGRIDMNDIRVELERLAAEQDNSSEQGGA